MKRKIRNLHLVSDRAQGIKYLLIEMEKNEGGGRDGLFFCSFDFLFFQESFFSFFSFERTQRDFFAFIWS